MKCYILYRSPKLQCEDAHKTKVTKTLESVDGWKTHYSKWLCVQVFTLKGKEDTSMFVAISLHAPYKDKKEIRQFCDLVKAFIEEVITFHRLPVLVGGDFNTDIRHWKGSGFKGLDYDTDCIPRDFITMKVPEEKYHLEMAEVQKMECDTIAIPKDAKAKRFT